MAKKEGKFKKTATIPAHAEDVQLAGDAISFFALLISVFLSLILLALFFSGSATPVSNLLTSLRAYVFPWLIVIALLSIGKEFWAIRVYLKHIHLGNILEKYMEEKH